MSLFEVLSSNRPTVPIWSSSRYVRSCVCPLPMQLFCVDWGGASLVRGLVRSVPRPRMEPKNTGRLSALDASTGGGGVIFFGKKNAFSPLFAASRNKNIGATSPICQKIWCLPYATFFEKCFGTFQQKCLRVKFMPNSLSAPVSSMLYSMVYI